MEALKTIDPSTPRPYHLVEPEEKWPTWRIVRVSAGGYSAHNFKTREEAEAQYAEWEAIGRCRECGDVLNDGYMEPYKTRIHAEKLCISCQGWLDELSRVSDPAHVVVGGYHYTIWPDKKPNCGSYGHGGARFDIQFSDGREVVTHNLWASGKVPDHFRERMPDNAVFVQRGHKAVGNYRGGGGYVGHGSADASVQG